MKVHLNKKGFFFTIIALIIVTLLFMMFMGRGETVSKRGISVDHKRVEVVNNYVRSAEEIYIKRMLVASSYKAIDEYIDHYQGGSPQKTLGWFDDLLITGVLDLGDRMGKHKLRERLRLLENVTFEMLHLNASFRAVDAQIYQNDITGPWRVGVNLTVHMFVDGGAAVWNKTTVITGLLSVEGMDDPLIKMNTDKAEWMINKSYFEGNWTGAWEGQNARENFLQGMYKQDARAPSYINRLMNSTENSTCCGIESMIDFTRLGLPPKNVSSIDYCYFNESFGCIGGDYGKFIWEIDGISNNNNLGPSDPVYPNFRLDSYHLAQYNASEDDKCEYRGGTSWTGTGCVGGGSAPPPPSGTCGNNVLDAGEACDDGNDIDCDGCKGDCSRQDALCGDSIVECGELCDPPDAGITCDALCQQTAIPPPGTHCGDGQWNGDESDFNCGGSCPPCPAGLSCWQDSDCTNTCIGATLPLNYPDWYSVSVTATWIGPSPSPPTLSFIPYQGTCT